MPTSKVREIPILREAGHHQSYPVAERMSSPASCSSAREIPIQRETVIGNRPMGDFFHHRQDPSWGNHWPNHGSDMFEGEPFRESSGFRSQAGFPGFSSHTGNDFWGGHHSPSQMQFSRHPGDSVPSHRVASPLVGERRSESPVTSSQAPQQPATNEVPREPLADKAKRSVPIVVEPAVSDAPMQSEVPTEARSVPIFVEPTVCDAPMSSEAHPETKNDATDGSLHVEEPTQRTRSPSPSPPNMTPLEIIEQVMAEGDRLKVEVEVYSGGRKEKPYLRLEEMLTRLLIKLDRIESEGRDDIRKARRDAVHAIQSVLDLLESRASESVPATNDASNLPSSERAITAETPSQESSLNTDSSCTESSQKDKKQAPDGVDVAAVKEMILGSEVAC